MPGAESQLGFRPCDAFFQGSFCCLPHAYLSLASYPTFLTICQTLLLLKNGVLALPLAKFLLLLLSLVLCAQRSKVNHMQKKTSVEKPSFPPVTHQRWFFSNWFCFCFYSGSDCQTLNNTFISMFLPLSYFYSIYCLKMGIELCCPASSVPPLSVFHDDFYSFWSVVLLNCNLHLHFTSSNFNQFS